MKIFKITTFETIPIVKEFLYTVEAMDTKEARQKVISGNYEEVLHIRDLNTIETLEKISIQNIREEEK